MAVRLWDWRKCRPELLGADQVSVTDPDALTDLVFTLSYDFIAKGPNATWRNATTNLPWGDPDDDTPGVAVNVANVKMEDGKTYSSLLATYPQKITDGMVLGLLPRIYHSG